MSFDNILEILNDRLLTLHNSSLNETEILILQGIWQDQTYSEIAEQKGYSANYLTNVVARELYRRLSELIGERITKRNCRAQLESYVTQITTEQQMQPLNLNGSEQLTSLQAESEPLFYYPNGAVPLNSPVYLERFPIEKQVAQEIQKPGALVRIKAPREMGKTSLLLRILDRANSLGYHCVSLNLQEIGEAILNDHNRFLRWLCASVTRQLELEPKLDEYWDEDIGSNVSCSVYFRNYLLESLNSPLILALDETQEIFEYPQVARNFFPLLRSWYEEAKRLPIWQKLRLIVVHSTEIYIPLQLNQSPFNVGLPIQLTNFSIQQIMQLAERYQLNWEGEEEAKELMEIVGGHPALVHLALYSLSRDPIPLRQLIKTASSPNGIYFYHLQRYWASLQEQPELLEALAKIMKACEPVELEPVLAYKLTSMGLIQRAGDGFIPGCKLYRQYFDVKQSHEPIRKRGVLLTTEGLKKLKQARSKAEWDSNRGRQYTLEELSECTNLSKDSLAKIFKNDKKVDQQTIKECFQAFDLVLTEGDYYWP